MSYTYSSPDYYPCDGPRRNSDNTYEDLQYYTPRGKIPGQVVSHTIRDGLAPRDRDAVPKPKQYPSGYPDVYKNREGRAGAQHENYEPWQRVGADKLYEYPVRLPGKPEFDYDRKAATKAQVERVYHPNDRRRLAERPLNDPGYARAITDMKQSRVIGANYHPYENPRGFEQAPLEPLDRAGRQYLHMHNDQELFRRETFPPR